MAAVANIVEQLYFPSKRLVDADSPLDSACDWVRSHVKQNGTETPFLIFNEEQGDATTSWRRICGVEITAFLALAIGRRLPMFYHEIAPSCAPIKLAFDLEVNLGDERQMATACAKLNCAPDGVRATCDAVAQRLLLAALASLSTLVGRSLGADSAVVLDCSRADKWSRHITIDGATSTTPSIVFNTNLDCREFVSTLRQRPELVDIAGALELMIDMGVYSNRHPLRTYFSAKRARPDLLFRRNSEELECDRMTMAKALRTCITMPSCDGAFYHQPGTGARLVTSAYLEATESARLLVAPLCLTAVQLRRSVPTSTTRAPDVAGGSAWAALQQAIRSDEQLLKYQTHRITRNDTTTLFVACKTYCCETQPDGEHDLDKKTRSQCVYLSIDLITHTFAQLCHASGCIERRRGKPVRRHQVSPQLADAIENYLNSDEWLLSEVVGPDFCAALGVE